MQAPVQINTVRTINPEKLYGRIRVCVLQWNCGCDLDVNDEKSIIEKLESARGV